MPCVGRFKSRWTSYTLKIMTRIKKENLPELKTSLMHGETEQQYHAWLLYNETGSLEKLLRAWERVCQGYANDMPEFWSNELLQTYSSITPKITMRLLQFFSNTSPENKGFSLKTAGQSRYEIGIKIVRWVFGRIAVTLRWFVGGMLATGFGKVSVRVRYPQGIKHRQLSLKTRLNNEKVTVKSRKNHRTVFIAYPTLSFIVHSFIVHNKRASYGYTKVTPTLHQECDQLLPNATRNRPLFSLFDITRVSLYVVLPDQKI